MASSDPSGSLLPLDLVENILCRIPVESLVRLKYTCKQWLALLNDKRFIYKHLDLSREGFIEVPNHKSFQFINLETPSLSIHPEHPSGINSMIHCDGLLLCELMDQDIGRKLAIWNPFLSRVKLIETSSSFPQRYHNNIHGFGYDNVSRDNYKILRFSYESRNYGVEIYEFKTQLWRSVDYSCVYSWYPSDNQAVSMNGNMYWFARSEEIDNSRTEFFIRCFDFSREIFKDTCCVPFLNLDDWFPPFLSCFQGDKLSLLSQRRYGQMIQVWVTNKVADEVVSWSKYFNVTLPYPLTISSGYVIDFPSYFIHKSNRIMLWCEEKDDQNIGVYVNVYEIGEGEVTKQVVTGRHRRSGRVRKLCYVFVPSLVPVPE